MAFIHHKLLTMSNIWFTSDNHYFHKRIQEFCPNTRRGSSVHEMNELMIEKHNELVSPNDQIWFLGDFSFGTSAETNSVLNRLNGTKHLIFGNHDKVLRNDKTLQRHFESCQEYKRIVVDKINVIMFHYPIVEWDSMHRGAYHLFGHVHGKFQNLPCRTMDVGIDSRPTNDMAPWNWDEIDRILKKQDILPHHNK